MKHIYLAFILLIFVGCGSGIGSQERLGWYVPFVPDDLVVERFYETPSPSMDHEYMWQIKIVDNDDFSKFATQFTKAPPNAIGVSDAGVAVFDEHPAWWRKLRFPQKSLHRHRVTVVGSGGGERADVIALFDKNKGCLYIQAY